MKKNKLKILSLFVVVTVLIFTSVIENAYAAKGRKTAAAAKAETIPTEVATPFETVSFDYRQKTLNRLMEVVIVPDKKLPNALEQSARLFHSSVCKRVIGDVFGLSKDAFAREGIMVFRDCEKGDQVWDVPEVIAGDTIAKLSVEDQSQLLISSELCAVAFDYCAEILKNSSIAARQIKREIDESEKKKKAELAKGFLDRVHVVGPLMMYQDIPILEVTAATEEYEQHRARFFNLVEVLGKSLENQGDFIASFVCDTYIIKPEHYLLWWNLTAQDREDVFYRTRRAGQMFRVLSDILETKATSEIIAHAAMLERQAKEEQERLEAKKLKQQQKKIKKTKTPTVTKEKPKSGEAIQQDTSSAHAEVAALKLVEVKLLKPIVEKKKEESPGVAKPDQAAPVEVEIVTDSEPFEGPDVRVVTKGRHGKTKAVPVSHIQRDIKDKDLLTQSISSSTPVFDKPLFIEKDFPALKTAPQLQQAIKAKGRREEKKLVSVPVLSTPQPAEQPAAQGPGAAVTIAALQVEQQDTKLITSGDLSHAGIKPDMPSTADRDLGATNREPAQPQSSVVSNAGILPRVDQPSPASPISFQSRPFSISHSYATNGTVLLSVCDELFPLRNVKTAKEIRDAFLSNPRSQVYLDFGMLISRYITKNFPPQPTLAS